MGAKIRKVRATKGLSRGEVAERAKISSEHINCLEAGRYDPGVGTLRAIARALGVPVVDLLA